MNQVKKMKLSDLYKLNRRLYAQITTNNMALIGLSLTIKETKDSVSIEQRKELYEKTAQLSLQQNEVIEQIENYK